MGIVRQQEWPQNESVVSCDVIRSKNTCRPTHNILLSRLRSFCPKNRARGISYMYGSAHNMYAANIAPNPEAVAQGTTISYSRLADLDAHKTQFHVEKETRMM